MKNVTSKDPRKPAIVARLKAKADAGKVTCLKEDKAPDGSQVFHGSCLRYCWVDGRGFYQDLGTFSVTAHELGWTTEALRASGQEA